MNAASVAGLLAEGTRRLAGPEARFEAELLLGHALQHDRAWLFAHADAPVEDGAAARFLALCQRRVAGEPVAHLLRRRGFWTLDLEVTPATLVPRPETELLVDAALARIPVGQALDLADLGTGTGAVALAIAAERPLSRVLATDASGSALDVARRNARRNGIANVAFACGEWLEPLAGRRFWLLASNPPYIASGDPHLGEGDLRFEPRMALESGPDGLDALRTIAGGAASVLHPGGWVLLEHGHAQGAAVRALLQRAAFTEVETLRDLEQRDRVTVGRAGP